MATSKARAKKAPLNRESAMPWDGVLRDEGMWTFDNPPTQLLKQHYGFRPDKRWLEEVRLAAVRFNDGGSGSFVSPNGLVLTNHHVAMGQLAKLSSARSNYVRDGFYARRRSEELRCPDLELNQLVELTNVTGRVSGAAKSSTSEREANQARKAAIARIEKKATDATGDRCDVVELYQGGEYWLYRYKKFTDVRLVMAPESETAFFGGDPDNFTYPRYALDFAFFRVYVDNQPFKTKHFFRWSKRGASEGELTFVIGHPGSTQRLLTQAQLTYQRDVAIPKRLEMYRRRHIAVTKFGQTSAEAARQSQDYKFGLENALKVVGGEYERLCDGPIFGDKLAREAEFRRLVQKSPALRKDADAWDNLKKIQKKLQQHHLALTFRRLSGYRLMGIADAIVRYADEINKPNHERLEEFRDSNLASLRHRLLSPAPIYPALERVLLADGLAESLERLGSRDPFIKAVLGRKRPEDVAEQVMSKTQLASVDFRKTLLEGGIEAIQKSRDPLIALSRRADPHYRKMRQWYEDEVQSVERSEGDRIARARFTLYGKRIYPDATFTLRLSYGRALGYDWDKTKVPFQTTFYGLYDRAESFENKSPFRLPKQVHQAASRVDLAKPINFVTTHDIIGGNSGSPVVNAKRQLVGLIFDGNIQSFATSYAYTADASRAVSVHSEGIHEALRSIYRMKNLIRELGLP